MQLVWAIIAADQGFHKINVCSPEIFWITSNVAIAVHQNMFIKGCIQGNKKPPMNPWAAISIVRIVS